MVYSINWPNFIVWFLLFLAILDKMCIIYFPVHDFIKFEINFLSFLKTFLSSRFPTWPQKSWQKLKYLKNEKSF